MKGSRINAEITLEKPSLVFFSVPWSEGWSAEVNGVSADVENVDNGLMAVRCDAGKSSITFEYRNKYTSAGLIVTLSGAGILTVYLILCRVIKTKQKSEQNNIVSE